jgi:trans-2,3-dihydro-3-hydroxyanthranilate isomerase
MSPEMRPYEVVDVFTNVPLEGNPVAVFTDGGGLDEVVMQRLARELNLSETVFLLDRPEGADVHARIFTPTTELPFAGHPVLGAAAVFGGLYQLERVRLQTGAGVIAVQLRRRDDQVEYCEMEQPIPSWSELEQAPELLAALGLERSELPVEVYDNGPRHAFVALSTEAEVAALRPNLAALADVGSFGVSCFAGSGTRVKTRMFGPALGVPEDPATGSAAGPLAVHLARHGRTEFGQWIEIRQGEEIGRPSLLHAVAEGSGERLERVRVGGGAVIVAGGAYQVG